MSTVQCEEELTRGRRRGREETRGAEGQQRAAAKEGTGDEAGAGARCSRELRVSLVDALNCVPAAAGLSFNLHSRCSFLLLFSRM